MPFFDEVFLHVADQGDRPAETKASQPQEVQGELKQRRFCQSLRWRCGNHGCGHARLHEAGTSKMVIRAAGAPSCSCSGTYKRCVLKSMERLCTFFCTGTSPSLRTWVGSSS